MCFISCTNWKSFSKDTVSICEGDPITIYCNNKVTRIKGGVNENVRAIEKIPASLKMSVDSF